MSSSSSTVGTTVSASTSTATVKKASADATREREEQSVIADMRRQLVAVVPTMQEELEALNTRQTLALYHLFKGRNVFLSGLAGTGKTYTTKTIVKFMTAIKQKVALTATTGLAAANLEDAGSVVVPKTLHSFAGIGLGEESADELIKKLKEQTFVAAAARTRWRETNLLVVDEVSMMSPVFFTKLDKIARSIRNRPNESFGGMTLLFVGDFHQLAAVLKGNEKQEANAMSAEYCFQTPAWCAAVDVEIMLDQVYRQQDEQFVGMLQEVREGRASQRTIQRLHLRTDLRLRVDLDAVAHTHFGGERYAELSRMARARFEQWSQDIDPSTLEKVGENAPGEETRIALSTNHQQEEEEQEDDNEEEEEEEDDEDEEGGGKRKRARLTTEEDDDEEEEEKEEKIDWSRYDVYARSVARTSRFDETEALIRLLPPSLIDSAHQVYISEVMPTRLMAVNHKVEAENLKQLNAIHRPAMTYDSRLSLNINSQHSLNGRAMKEFGEYFKKNILAPAQLHLKIGAQVMLLANIKPPTLVNGRRGVIVAFRTLEEHDAASGIFRSELTPPPSPDRSFSAFLSNGRGGKKKRAPKKKRRTGSLSELTEKEIDALDKTAFPVVRFDNGVESRIEPFLWSRQKRFDKKQVKAHYLQVPLILAYAISIHKVS